MKKILSLGLICMFFLTGITTVSASEIYTTGENESRNGFGFRSIFAAQPLITIITEDTSKTVIPNTKAISIPIEISYDLTGPFASWQQRRLRGTTVQIELAIEEKPDWCDASLINNKFDLPIVGDTPHTSVLTVSVNEQAPANTLGYVRIKATSEEISGLIFTRVMEGELEAEIGFVIGYWPCISLELPEGSYFEIPPLSNTKIPIKLTNLGNAPTILAIEVTDIPKNWNYTFPSSLVLNSPISGEKYEKEIEFTVRPPKDFSRETIKIRITPSLLGDPDNQGLPEVLIFTFKNDGSYKEEGPDIFLFIIMIVAIALLILGLIFVKRKYFTK